MCGNHEDSPDPDAAALGSPPRVREPRITITTAVPQIRITPACAGTTAPSQYHSCRSRDHPRVCGNHCGNCLWVDDIEGSPPRVREPLRWFCLSYQSRRITPACAGTTALSMSTSSPSQDHPRVCGNHPLRSPSADPIRGSPPRVREPRAADCPA